MLDASSMAARVKAKIAAAVPPQTVADGVFNVLVQLCEGIIEEIQEEAELVGVTTAPGAPLVGKVV